MLETLYGAVLMKVIIFWLLPTVLSIWGILHLLAKEGKVSNGDRVMLFFSLIPGISILIVGVLILVVVMFKIDAWYNSPKMVAWRIERKIRKRRRGPIVRIVEHMHKKHLEKNSEKDLPEV